VLALSLQVRPVRGAIIKSSLQLTRIEGAIDTQAETSFPCSPSSPGGRTMSRCGGKCSTLASGYDIIVNHDDTCGKRTLEEQMSGRRREDGGLAAKRGPLTGKPWWKNGRLPWGLHAAMFRKGGRGRFEVVYSWPGVLVQGSPWLGKAEPRDGTAVFGKGGVGFVFAGATKVKTYRRASPKGALIPYIFAACCLGAGSARECEGRWPRLG
jgi:hypothetical protein